MNPIKKLAIQSFITFGVYKGRRAEATPPLGGDGDEGALVKEMRRQEAETRNLLRRSRQAAEVILWA
jgi:hypothetical protein